jgi:hypothetical protein
MNSKIAKALLAATAVVLVVAVVGMAAYHLGVGNMGFDRHPGFWPMMRDRSGHDGMGFFGLVLLVLLGLAVAVVVAVLLGWGRGTSEVKPPSGMAGSSGTASGTADPAAGTAAPGAAPVTADTIAQLKELSDLHDRGALNDEEFAAAKRRLLGL